MTFWRVKHGKVVEKSTCPAGNAQRNRAAVNRPIVSSLAA
jgi:hypothetical protein